MAEVEKLTSIDFLNIDCLSTVFRHLSIVDRIKIERVNKHWNEVSKSSWGDIKKLNLYAPSWGFKPRGFLSDSYRKIKLFELEEVLKRCGQFLEDINTISEMDKFEQNLLNVIACHCPNVKLLETIIIIGGFKALSENCSNLIELTLRDHNFERSPVSDNELSCLFIKNKKLQSLKFFSESKITGTCLLNLASLETLDLSYDVNDLVTIQNFVNALNLKIMNNLKVFKVMLISVQINNVMDALQNCSNLEELCIKFSPYENSNFSAVDVKLGLIFKNNQNLKILSFERLNLTGECFKNLNADSITEITLNYCQSLNTYYLNKYILKFCKLIKLEYYHNNYSNSNTSNDALTFIASLENLKFLTIMSDIKKSDNHNLKLIANLKELTLGVIQVDPLEIIKQNLINLTKLSLIYCYEMTDIGLEKLTSLPKLEDLSLYSMHNITDKGFNKMENLKKLQLTSCQKIKIDALKKILTTSEKLNYLSIENCSNINKEDLLIFTNEITKKRTNNIILYINDSILRTTNANFLMNIKKSPFLEYINDTAIF